MAIERTEVRYNADTRQVDSSVKRLNTELDGLTQKAQESIRRTRQARAESAGLGSGFRVGAFRSRFASRLSAGSLVTGGFSAAGIARTAAPLLAVHAAGRGLESLFNLQETLRERRAAGQTDNEIQRAVALGAAGSATRSALALTGAGTLATQIWRGISGRSGEESRADFERMLDDWFSTREEIRRRQEAQDRAREEALAEINQRRDTALGKLRATLPASFRLKTSEDVKLFRLVLEHQTRPDGTTNRDAVEDAAKEARVAAVRASFNEGR